jgi:pRiA4b ORF-3-like protein
VNADETVSPVTIATLRIDLLDTDPPIWREVDVPLSMTLKELHAVIQAAVGWEDTHLWEFAIGRERINTSHAANLSLRALLRPRTTKLTYIYDFGDCWEHQLTLTQPRVVDPNVRYPRYIAGQGATPLEDSGGIPGFYSRLAILDDPNHPNYDDIKEWFGEYDPSAFDEQPIIDRLARIAARRGTEKTRSRSR